MRNLLLHSSSSVLVSKIEPSGFEFSKPSLNNMQTFYETNPTSINGKTKRHPLTKIITDVVYKEKKNRGGNMNKMTVYKNVYSFWK